MSDRMKENVIEWIENDQIASCTFSQRRYISKIRKLVAEGAEGFEILVENPDGSIFCHIPVKAIHIFLKTITVSEEELARRAEHIRNVRKSI